MEAIILAITIILMLAATGVKYFAAKSIARMKFQIGQQQQVTGEAKGRLKGVENKKKVLEQNRDILSKKRSKLSKQLAALTVDLEQLEQDKAKRQQGDDEENP